MKGGRLFLPLTLYFVVTYKTVSFVVKVIVFVKQSIWDIIPYRILYIYIYIHNDKNVLKRRECGTYLATARRHRRRLKMMTKRDKYIHTYIHTHTWVGN